MSPFGRFVKQDFHYVSDLKVDVHCSKPQPPGGGDQAGAAGAAPTRTDSDDVVILVDESPGGPEGGGALASCDNKSENICDKTETAGEVSVSSDSQRTFSLEDRGEAMDGERRFSNLSNLAR